MMILAALLLATTAAEETEGRRIPTFGGGRHVSHGAPPRTLASCLGADGSLTCPESRRVEKSDGQVPWLVKNVFRHTRLREEPGVFVEFGSLNGIYTSNTFMFEKLFGWSGVMIEADRGFFPNLRKNRACRVDGREGACVWAMLGETKNFKSRDEVGDRAVEMHSLESVLDHLNVTHIDYMSADCENCEEQALASLDMSKVSVDVFTVEFPRCAVAQKLAWRGYVAVPLHVGYDVVFVHPSVAAKMPPPDMRLHPGGVAIPHKLWARVASWYKDCPEASKMIWREGDAWPPAVGKS